MKIKSLFVGNFDKYINFISINWIPFDYFKQGSFVLNFISDSKGQNGDFLCVLCTCDLQTGVGPSSPTLAAYDLVGGRQAEPNNN